MSETANSIAPHLPASEAAAPEAAFEIRELSTADAARLVAAAPAAVPLFSIAASAMHPTLVQPAAEQLDDAGIAALLAGAVSGRSPVAPAHREVTTRVAGALSEIERAAVTGEALRCDAAPLRDAAVLRWRVAAVLDATRGGAAVDAVAAGALPAAIDEVLRRLKALADGGPDVEPAVSAVRNALVREAIALTDALARQSAGPAPAATPPVLRQQAGARVLSNERAVEDAAPRARTGLVALVVVVAVAVGAFHLHARLTRPQPAPLPRMAGAPDGFVLQASPSSSARVLTLEPGRSASAAEVERFVKEQEAKGMTVVQVAPHLLVVRPAAEGKPAAAAPAGQPASAPLPAAAQASTTGTSAPPAGQNDQKAATAAPEPPRPAAVPAADQAAR